MYIYKARLCGLRDAEKNRSGADMQQVHTLGVRTTENIYVYVYLSIYLSIYIVLSLSIYIYIYIIYIYIYIYIYMNNQLIISSTLLEFIFLSLKSTLKKEQLA